MPGWRWEAKIGGKTASGWTSGSQLLTRELLLAHLQVAYHNLDFSDFNCEPNENPPLIVRPVPPAWFGFDTTRMKAEIDAGLRPYTDTLEPPLEGVDPEPLINRLLTPLAGPRNGLRPLSRRPTNV